MWHGIQINIFIWTLLNFIGVVIESVGVSIGKSTQYRKIQNIYLSAMNTRRFHCILASPLLAMSTISNFYFFGGEEIGNIFVHNILYGKSLLCIYYMFLMYILTCKRISAINTMDDFRTNNIFISFMYKYINCTNDLILGLL